MGLWLRYYTDTLNNPKVQTLPPDLFKAWINLLCCAKQDGGAIPPVTEIAFRLRCTPKTARRWITELRERQLIDGEADGPWTPHDWDEHQYASGDNSAERMRRYRVRRKRNGDGESDGESDGTALRNGDANPIRRAEQSRAEIQSRAESAASQLVVDSTPEEPPPPTANELHQSIKALAARGTNGTSHAQAAKNLEAYEWVRGSLLNYPGADRLPGKPDDVVIRECLELARGDTQILRRALVAMHHAHKAPASSWKWFPSVLKQYAGSREREAV